jgi:hypothetical protein
MKKIFITAVGLLACMARGASADSVSLALIPGAGALAGDAGSTSGWGFTLANSTSDFLVVANSFFCEEGQSPASSTCVPRLGVYSDIAAGNATLVGPGSSVTQAFKADGSSGLGSFSIWSSAAPGQSDSGSIYLVYDLFDADPFTGPANQIGGDHMLSSAAQVSVGKSTTAAPEPALPLLSGLALLAGLSVRRRFRSRLTASA